MRDLVFACRRLLKCRKVSLPALALLALGTGATVLVFGLGTSLLSGTVPGVASSDRLVTLVPKAISVEALVGQELALPLSLPAFERFQKHSFSFAGLAAYQPTPIDLYRQGETMRVQGQVASANLFSVLGVRMALGRPFSSEDSVEAARVAVLSYGLWQRGWGESPNALGQVVTLNGKPFEVIGVAPKSFRGASLEHAADLWLTLAAAPQVVPGLTQEALADPGRRWLFWFCGRLRPGASLVAAQAEMSTLASQLGAWGAADEDPTELEVHPGLGLAPQKQGDLKRPLKLLAWMSVLFLALICSNLAALLVSRAWSSGGELALRRALGASRSQLMKMPLFEALVLATAGTLTGCALAWLASGKLSTMRLGVFLPQVEILQLDWRLTVLCGGLVFATTLGSGLLPALLVSCSDLRQPTGSTSRGKRFGVHELLLVPQVAVSLGLVVAAGLLARSLDNLRGVELGFQPQQVLNVEVDLALQNIGEANGIQFYLDLLQRLRAFPGVENVSLAANVPFRGSGVRRRMASVSADPMGTAADEAHWVAFNIVSEDYFRTLRIPLVAGRDFSPDDSPDSQLAVVNQAMARLLWPDGAAVGRAFELGPDHYQVVGVARDLLQTGLRESAAPYFYLPFRQRFEPTMTVHLRAPGDPLELAEATRNAVRELLATVPVVRVERLQEGVASALAQPRLFLQLVSALGLLALLAAALGLYSALSYSTSRRVQEIGVRRALGASTRSVLASLVKRTAWATLCGLSLGTLLVGVMGRYLSDLLFGVDLGDPGVIASTLALLSLAVIVGTLLPARAALAIEPQVAIRRQE